jgi:uncharacterized membrane protein
MYSNNVQGLALTGLQIEGVLAYFMHLKYQKRIGDDVEDLKYVSPNFLFFLVKITRLICFIQLIMQEYDSSTKPVALGQILDFGFGKRW